MANLAIPPPSRVAIGYTMVGGERQDVYLNIEWARYFESLNGQVTTVSAAVGLPGAPGQTGAAGSSLAMSGDGDGASTEFIMVGGGTVGATGPQGATGLQGPPIELATDADNSVEFIPLAGAAGAPGTDGAPGPVLFVSEPESVSEFIPLAGPQGTTGLTGPVGGSGAALFMLGDPDPQDVIPLPGPQGVQGTTGNAGANGSALFMLGEADAPDPIVYPGPTGPAGATGPTGSVGAAGAALFMLGEADAQEPPSPMVASHPDEAFTTPTLLNSWVAIDSIHNTPGFFMDAHGIVHLRGMVALGAINTPIFTLPAGYRPTKREFFAITSNDLFGICYIDTNGTVQAYVGSNVYFSLDGITFRAANTF